MMIKEENYDPKLREVIRQMKKTMKRNNVGGVIILISETHSEFRMHFPTWTALNLKGQELRIRANRNDFISEKEQKKIVGNSAHVLCQIRDICGYLNHAVQGLIELLSQKIIISHKPFHDFHPDYEDYED